ncbi:MAG: cadherin-like domain-containing protein, partial [Rhodobacter sp.]|nr:cadherin-like domain-containing protein [Rhodobacter sp.]
NDAPTAVDDVATTDEDTSVVIDVLANDSDLEGDDLSVIGASAANGSVVINEDGTLTYTPNEDYTGNDTITYTISDGNGGEATASVDVTVNPVNDAPDTTAANDPAETVNEADGPGKIDLATRTSDVDGDAVSILSARFVDPVSGAIVPVQVTLDGGFACFDPADFGLDTGESLVVRLEYLVMDDSGAVNSTATGSVDVTINGADDVAPSGNNAPVAGVLDLTADPAFDEANGDISVDIGSVISDLDGDTLTVVALVTDDGQEVSFTQTGTVLTFDPQQFLLAFGQSGQINLSFVIDDGSGEANSQAEGAILFNLDGADDVPTDPTNTAPVAAAIAVTANEVDGELAIDLNAGASDPDGDAVVVTAVRVVGGGTVAFSLENGVLVIDPAVFGLGDGETDTFEFEYDVEDDSGQSNNTTTGTLSVTINGFTEGPPPDPETTATLDFEAFASADGFSLDISNVNYQGFTFSGSALVIETDEFTAGGGRNDPTGIADGQTTPGGDNVMLGTVTTQQVPVLDPVTGEPVVDHETGEVLVETIVLEPFGIFGPGAGLDFGEGGIFYTSGIAGSPPPVPEELPDAIGDSFSLDGMSLNLPSGATTVVITTYTIGMIEIVDQNFPSQSQYYLDYVALDTFEFTLDGSTPATMLDFNDPAFMDALGNTNMAGFDDIYAITFETLDGSAMVFDDILITL